MHDGLKMAVRVTYSPNSAFATIRDNNHAYYPTSIGIVVVAAAVVTLLDSYGVLAIDTPSW